ncbi:MAG: branched-chain amino acid ABC transporter permease [Alphaproteobacteria bacterium]|nr:branched-chain amino acid ABC transporter permease [Alphaproteobacteria bacterium]
MWLDTLLSGQLLFSALVTGSLYAIVAVGLNLVYGTMRLLNVAHGDLVMGGAYLAYWSLTLLGVPPLLSLWMIGLGGALIGLALYRSMFRRLLIASADPGRVEANSLLLFFGISILVQNTIAWFATPTPRAYLYLDDVYKLGDTAMTGNRIASLVTAAATCAGIWLYLRHHVVGLALRAVIDSPLAARIVGVNVEQVHRTSFVLGFASASVAGVLVSMMEQFSPFVGFPFSIAAFIVCILGGLGNIGAGFVAALFLGVIETYGIALTSLNWRSVLLYGVFVATLLAFPQGLFGRRVRS